MNTSSTSGSKDWLVRLAQQGHTRRSGERAAHGQVAAEYLRRAAMAYFRAGWHHDACRTYESLGDDRRAAPLHENLGRWGDAAECYDRVEDWRNAARCFLQAGRANEAAECLYRLGEGCRAAWVWSDGARRFAKASSVAKELQPESDVDRLARLVVLSRCETGLGNLAEGARLLFQAIGGISELPGQERRSYLHDWVLKVAKELQRPDLAMLTHAAAVAVRAPDAEEVWNRWAAEVLGDSKGIPSAIATLDFVEPPTGIEQRDKEPSPPPSEDQSQVESPS